MMYCTACGNTLSSEDRFCAKCGKEIQKKSSAPRRDTYEDQIVAPVSEADTALLKSFADSFTGRILWGYLLLYLLVGVLIGGMFLATSEKAVFLLLIAFGVIQLVGTFLIPYQAMKKMTNTQVGFLRGNVSRPSQVRVYPSPATDADYFALAWGFVWRVTIVGALLVSPLHISDYSPSDIEHFIVALFLMPIACWLASRWLVLAPLGNCRLQSYTPDL
jgi:hypothetical protein